MIYQNVAVYAPDAIYYPDGAKEGFDRLSFSFPFPGVDGFIKNNIDSGALDRYFGPLDSVTYYPDCIVAKTVYNNKQAAEQTAAEIKTNPSVRSIETLEIPE